MIGWYDLAIAFLDLDPATARSVLRSLPPEARTSAVHRATAEVVRLGAPGMWTGDELLRLRALIAGLGGPAVPELEALAAMPAGDTVDADVALLAAWLASETRYPLSPGFFVGCKLYDHSSGALILDCPGGPAGYALLRRAIGAGLVVRSEWGSWKRGAPGPWSKWQKRYAATAPADPRHAAVLAAIRAGMVTSV